MTKTLVEERDFLIFTGRATSRCFWSRGAADI